LAAFEGDDAGDSPEGFRQIATTVFPAQRGGSVFGRMQRQCLRPNAAAMLLRNLRHLQQPKTAMGRTDRRVLFVLTAAVLVGAAVAVLYFANIWWLSGIVTLSIGAWLAGVLAALVAALAASLLYVTFALGPWFRSQVSPWLLTTRGLAVLEHQVFQRPMADSLLALQYAQPIPFGSTAIPTGGWPAGWPAGSGSTLITTTNVSGGVVWATPTATIPVGTDLPATTLVQVGHWFCAWLAAGIGAIAVTWARRRASRRSAAGCEPGSAADEVSGAAGNDAAAEEPR
jgi:hypothetical protein